MSKHIINSRADLDVLQGTPEYDEFITKLKGTLTRKQNVQVYPEDYGTPEYSGPTLEPIWEDIEDLTTITAFGFTKEELA